MKLLQLTSLLGLMASGALAHSWMECVDTQFDAPDGSSGGDWSPRSSSGELSWEASETNRANYKKNPTLMNDQVEKCKGFPRNAFERHTFGGQASGNHPDYLMPADWIDESSNYMYQFDETDSNGKVFACKANQRTRSSGGLPVAKVRPGQTVTTRFWGNGHSVKDPRYANPQDREPGVVRIYWAGKKDTELKYLEDLNEGNWIKGAQQGFGDDAIIDLTDIPTKNGDGDDQLIMKEWSNVMNFKIPKDISTGVHSMYWVWAWDISNTCPSSGPRPVDPNAYASDFKNSYSTCFDIEVVDGKAEDVSTSQSEWKAAVASKPKETEAGCLTPCFVGGMAEICDPSSGASCPPCRIRVEGKEHPDCYDSCNEWLKGDTCPTGGSKVRRHYRPRHRRSMM